MNINLQQFGEGNMFRVASILTCALAIAAIAVAVDMQEKNAPLGFTVQRNSGENADLAQYKGQVLLIVNTASKCGLTPQYEQLQELYGKYKESGFAVLAFPANNFGGQEPGSDEQIRQFCSVNYNVTFPLFSKVSVKGDDICPLYAYLTSEETNPGFSGEIGWNFTKFLVSRNGKVVARFEPRTRPDDEAVIAAIEKELAAE